MELYTQNIDHKRMILESVEHGPLIWPTIEENGVTRTKKYEELSATEKIQADCDLKATNIILQGRPSDVYSLVNHYKFTKDLWERFQLLMQAQGRQSSFVAGTSRTRANISGISGNNSGQQRIVKCFNCQGGGHMARQCPKPKRKRDATWFRDKVLLTVITHNADNLDAYDSDCADFSIAKAVLMANLSSYGSDVLSEEKNAQFVDFENEINYLKQTLSKQSKEKELLTKTFNVLKNESKEKEAKNIDKEIALEKKVKELENIIRPMLYDGSIIARETNVISIANSGETLMLEKESRLKILLKQSDPKVLEKKFNIKPINYAELNRLFEDFGKRFIPQQELSDEQAFRLQTSHPNTDQSASSPVDVR
ncbi:retrovirus-related pol polyprotein from transposon TNT 1-94 [Tanacetum coccineum]